MPLENSKETQNDLETTPAFTVLQAQASTSERGEWL